MGIDTAKSSVRPPAVAGLFYPGDPRRLRDDVDARLANASQSDVDAKVLIVPHAGYAYSGRVAAAAYAPLAARRGTITRVVAVGPSHRAWFRGVAVPAADAFATPLGTVPVDVEGRTRLLAAGAVVVSDAAHAEEHSLEVQLPFLQRALGAFTLLPLVTGEASAADVAAVLEAEWGGPETLVVVSSDLSHYLPYEAARTADAATAAAILARRPHLRDEQACGALAVNAALACAQRAGLGVTELRRENSGDTSGDRHRVVGYGAYALA